ncbi:6-phosphogluconolactonase [Biformimicrobium ophioploci]|uniref:6-phosphogluconolactonase n=1 Tax=Biformimicrobium ophioploci TaxID=3036711 RepID=A0ABQ6LWU3_9GAMM|nr:6-phosphogluconolactonase [Microbulbifer sp. NKW57]GMG86525.1 6-phosphogluconolactonase [Microbulbifer sp. NKW57]
MQEALEPVVDEKFFSSREEMFSRLTDHCAEALQGGVNQRGVATLLASGGSSPRPLYQALSKRPLAWDRINVALVDERWVEADSELSNERFISENLIQHEAASAHLMGMKNSAVSVFSGEPACNERYQQLPAPFDYCVLGMGEDGHTASLFPHAAGLSEALDSSLRCKAIRAHQSKVTGECVERMTMTLPAILSSRKIALVLTGDKKLAVYREALLGNDVSEMPIRSVLQQGNVRVCVYWAP